jgi:hypothetical protein
MSSVRPISPNDNSGNLAFPIVPGGEVKRQSLACEQKVERAQSAAAA